MNQEKLEEIAEKAVNIIMEGLKGNEFSLRDIHNLMWTVECVLLNNIENKKKLGTEYFKQYFEAKKNIISDVGKLVEQVMLNNH